MHIKLSNRGQNYIRALPVSAVAGSGSGKVQSDFANLNMR